MFATALKELRNENQLTQAQLAQKLGYSQSMITRWEKGECEPTESAIKKCALFFHVSSDFLIGLENEMGCKIEYSEEFTYTDGTHSINHKKKK